MRPSCHPLRCLETRTSAGHPHLTMKIKPPKIGRGRRILDVELLFVSRLASIKSDGGHTTDRGGCRAVDGIQRPAGDWPA